MSENTIDPPTTPKRPAVATFGNNSLLTTPPQSTTNTQNISPDNNTNTFQPPSTPSNRSNKLDSLSSVPLTPYSNNHNISSSPLKSPGEVNDEDDENKPPIRLISNTLKTRLSYAFVKYQKGWSNQSLDEIERSIDDKDDDSILPNKLQSSPAKSKKTSPSKVTKPIVTSNFKSPSATTVRSSNQRLLEKLSAKVPVSNGDSTDEEQDSPTTDYEETTTDYEEGSANKAFLHAISKQTSPKRKLQQLKAPRTPNLKLESTSLNSAYNPEADAIESLMSLSSPQYSHSNFNGSQSNSNSPKRSDANEEKGLGSSPKKKNYSFGENLKNVNKNDDEIDEDKTGSEEETEDDITDDERSESGV